MNRSKPQPFAPRAICKSRHNVFSRFAVWKSPYFKSIALISGAVLTVCFFSIAAFLFYSYLHYSKLVDERLASGYLTSRAGIYAAPRVLRVGQQSSSEKLTAALRRAGYVDSSDSAVWSGAFSVDDQGVVIRPRQSPGGVTPSAIRIGLDRHNRINEITRNGVDLESYRLEPESLTNDFTMKSSMRETLAFRDIPDVLVQAILATEDRRFFEHSGVDLYGVVRAALRNAGDDHISQGGSTITQQLVKNTYLSPERTLKRKFAEAMLAFTLERRLSKQDIFALYCNEIYLGQRGAVGVRGVQQAARVYFGKEVKDLTLTEAATIAGMIQSPNRYSPDLHPDSARERRNVVIGAMVRDGFVSLDQAAETTKQPVSLADFENKGDSLAPYFLDYVNRSVDAALATTDGDERNLRIFTTLDVELQQLAQQAVTKQLERLDRLYKGRGLSPQAALVAMDPETGNVLAMVGGRDYSVSQLNRATDAERQPGSVFKPIVYSAALQSGMSPLSLFSDAPHEFVYGAKSIYKPANFGGGYSMRAVTMRTALVRSLNVVTVDVAMQTGLNRIADLAQSLGLRRPQAYPALALGTTEATPLQVASAYSVFANQGRAVKPNVIGGIVDEEGRETTRTPVKGRQVLSPATAYIVTDMLSSVMSEGTARSARGAIAKTAVAGKTGTSRDGWFVGYTPNLVVAVWVGFDDNRQLGLTGAEAALPAWVDFMKGTVMLRPELGGEAFDRPAGVTFVDIDPETGMRASAYCPRQERVAIVPSMAPGGECTAHQPVINYVAETSTVNDDVTLEPAVQYQLVVPQRTLQPAVVPPQRNEKDRGALPPPITQYGRATRKDRDKHGAPILVNELAIRH